MYYSVLMKRKKYNKRNKYYSDNMIAAIAAPQEKTMRYLKAVQNYDVLELRQFRY